MTLPRTVTRTRILVLAAFSLTLGGAVSAQAQIIDATKHAAEGAGHRVAQTGRATGHAVAQGGRGVGHAVAQTGRDAGHGIHHALHHRHHRHRHHHHH